MSQATLGSSAYRNSSLFSGYYLDERIDDLEEWDCDQEAQKTFEELQRLWELEGELVSGYKEDELLDSWIDEVLAVLGFGTQSETTIPSGNGYNDRLLFESEETRRDAAKRAIDGDKEAMYGMAAAVLEAKQWDADFTKKFDEQRSYRDASHQIKYYLEHTPERLQWGILTDGKKWRLYGTKDYATEIYYEVDLPELLEAGELDDFKYFYAFFRPEAFREIGGSTFLDTVWNESETAAQELGEDLQDNVFTALRILGEGFIHTNDLEIDPDDEEARAELKEQSLVLLYRLMFVLYAESRGLIHPEDPDAQSEFEENFSLDQIRSGIHDAVTSGDSYDDWSGYATQIWGQLEDLFDLIDEGKEALGIPPYNGGLFDEEEHTFLAENEVADRYIAEVIHRLGTTEDVNGDPVLADYADLDTRHLGSIYEGLLEHEFRIASEPYAAVTEDGGQVWKPGTEVSVAEAVETVEEGELYVVNDDGERKATGAYYTPDYVVSYIVEETIDPLLDEIRTELEADGLEPTDQAYFGRFYSEVQDLKILDPAMGSAHFLTSATRYLTEQVMEIVREQEQQGRDEQTIRRTIAKECIYGVDVNGMAVELGKLSMWLETLAADKPLAFLDHHLKDGNSLVGSDISEVLSDDTEENGGQLTLTQAFAHARQQTLEHVMGLMEELLAIDNEDLADIKSMEELYDEIRDDPLYQRLFEIANVHTAEEFGLDVPEGVYEEMAGAIEDEDEWDKVRERDWFQSAQVMADKEDFFHWELEFPEAFFGADGKRLDGAGFDAVVGNPPYVSNWKLREDRPELVDVLESIYPEAASGHWDLFIPFSYQASQLTSDKGTHSFIVPNSFATEKYGKDLRKLFIEEKNIRKLVSFGEKQVFSGVDRQCMIYIITSNTGDEKCDITHYQGGKFHSEVTFDQKEFLNYSYNSFRIDLDSQDMKLKNKIDNQSIPLGKLCFVNPGVVAHSSSDSPLDFHKDDIIDDELGEGKKKYLSGGDIQRHVKMWDGKYMDYDSKREHFHRPKFPELFESPKIMFADVSGESSTIRGCYDDEGYYTNHSIMHAVAWTAEIEEHKASANYESVDMAEEYDVQYISGAVNSRLGNYYFIKFLATGTLQGSYSRMQPEDIRQLPVFEINFPLSNTEQQNIVQTIDRYLSEETKIPENNSIDEVLAQVREDSAFHKAISYLTNELMEIKETKQDLNLFLLDYLSNYEEGQTLSDVGLTQPPKGSADTILQETSEQKPKLRVGEITVVRESASTVEIQLTARYKPDDEDGYETDQWGYTETEPLPALRITDLTETEADLIEAFVPVAVDEAGGFANFRETATKTNSLVDRLRKLTLPAVDEVRDGLESYIATKERAEELEAKIEETDELIDEIVYELYGLTDEEIEIVEEAVNQ